MSVWAAKFAHFLRIALSRRKIQAIDVITEKVSFVSVDQSFVSVDQSFVSVDHNSSKLLAFAEPTNYK